MLDLDSELREISGARPQKTRPKLFVGMVHEENQNKDAPQESSRTLSTSRKAVDLNVVRQNIANLIGASAVSMVKTTIAEVDKGHYAAMKYLFELVGLFPSDGEPAAAGDGVLGKTLLRRLGLPEESTAGETVTKGTANQESDSQESKTDAVE